MRAILWVLGAYPPPHQKNILLKISKLCRSEVIWLRLIGKDILCRCLGYLAGTNLVSFCDGQSVQAVKKFRTCSNVAHRKIAKSLSFLNRCIFMHCIVYSMYPNCHKRFSDLSFSSGFVWNCLEYWFSKLTHIKLRSAKFAVLNGVRCKSPKYVI